MQVFPGNVTVVGANPFGGDTHDEAEQPVWEDDAGSVRLAYAPDHYATATFPATAWDGDELVLTVNASGLFVG